MLSFNDIVREPGFSFQITRMWGQAIFSPRGNLQLAERPAPAGERLAPLVLDSPMHVLRCLLR